MRLLSKLFFFLVSFLLYPSNSLAKERTHIDLPASEELHCIHFDRQGLLWMGTSAGIRSYDGYTVKEQFVEAVRTYPQLGSNVHSLTTDTDGNLWAGTNDGLVRIDMASGHHLLYRFPKQSQQIIYRLFTSKDGTVYVGTDDGFSIYDKEKKEFEHFNVDKNKALFPDGHTDKYTGWGVKDFLETPDGDILIGTWSQGLWRYSPKNNKIRAYAQVNWMNSAFTLCIDRQQRLWIGTPAYGVQRIDRIDDYKMETIQFVNSETANPRPHRVVHDLVELHDGGVYACTGDTIAAVTGPDGAIWIATRGSGIERVQVSNSLFQNYAQGNIRSIYTDNGQQFFLGYGFEGLAWYDTQTRSFLQNHQVPGYASLPSEGFSPSISSMLRRYNGELWIAAGDNGILVSRPDGTSEILYAHSRQMPYVRDNVTSLYESPRDQTLWIGQRQGVSFLLKNGKGVHLNVKTDSLDMTGYFMINQITADHEGRIWISSANNGIVRIDGDPADSLSLKYRHYITPCTNITACFEDSRHKLWAICAGGLLQYKPENDRFEPVSQSFHLAGKKVLAINEDHHGALWMATEKALVRLDAEGKTISFTEQDGLASTTFFHNSTFRHGDKMFFGTANGFVGFCPPDSYQKNSGSKPSLLITDILIDGSSILSLDSASAEDISSEHPMCAHRINIPASTKKFGIAFSLLTYTNQTETQYAYRLEGYDEDWQYVDGYTHCAIFDHVPTGTYQFHLRAADSRGEWYELPYHIRVRVLAPWYDTWWAYLIYICLLAVIARFVWNYLQMQREMEASRRFSTILQSAQIQAEASKINLDASEREQGTTDDTMQPQPSLVGQRNAEFIAKATQLVRDHLDDPDYNRDRMAADLGMSVSSLYSRLRECTGLSIQTFIQTIRLNAAADILRQHPEIRISELAYRVGFNTPKYFSQCFKKEFGVLPGDYIKK